MPEITLKTPEALMKLMEEANSEFARANRVMRGLEVEKMHAEARTAVILVAKRVDLLTNEGLKAQLSVCLKDSHFRWTKELLEKFSYLENQEIFEKYNEAEKIAKQAQKEFEMASSQLIYHQSQNKLKSAELASLGK